MTEGLYRRQVIAFTLFTVYPFSFVTKRKAVSTLNAVPDGDPNGVFSIYLFRSAILTVRKLLLTDKAALQSKRYIITPSAAAAAPPLKGRERRRWKAAQTLSLVGDTTPQSFRLVNKPKIQLPLHRGAENAPPTPPPPPPL